MERKDVIRNVLQAAGEFNDRHIWKRFTNFDCFAVRVPGEGRPMLSVVLGDAGEEYGLSLFRGPEAVASLAGLLDPNGPGDDALEAADMLGYSMEAFRDMPPDAQALVREVGQHPRHDEQVPHFLAKPPGRQPRLPDDTELVILLMALRGLVEADRRKLLQPARLKDKNGICVLALSGDPAAPQVSVTREQWQLHEVYKTVALPPERPDLRGLPRLKETWLVGMPALPGRIKGDDRVLELLLVADDASRYVLQARPVPAGEVKEAMKVVVETFHGKGLGGQRGLPRKIIFCSRRLHDVMAPILEQVDVKCIYTPTIAKLREIVADLIEHFGSELPSFADYIEAPSARETMVPAPDDLMGWKEAHGRLARRFSEYLQFGDRLRSSRAAKRYFDSDNLQYFLKQHKERAVAQAYTAWGILDYRPNKTSKTYAEKMLAQGLPEPEATLLRARMDSYPTLYRVASHDPKAGTIDLEDVLLGGMVTVHDLLMSENIENNLFFAARAFPAGRFHFIELAGPPLGAGMGLEAVEFLQDCGMEFTREGLRRDAHKFGWLWHWSDQWQANWKPPRLCNTDGDEFLWHTASFSVKNPQDTRLALLQREDIEHDEQEDEFVWVKETGRGAKMLGGPVTLGRIEFVGDELVLTVNSAKRFATARKWLEKLPGVVFLNVKTRRWDERDKDRPMDERISKPEPVEITPELAGSLQEMIDEQYMEWIDTALPVLGGKTPRQACQTDAGRQQVTMLIRTMPDPTGQASVHVPRQAMLSELGLTTESSTLPTLSPQIPQFPEPREPVLRDRRIARNAPCPCGSGRKYKKCCGR